MTAAFEDFKPRFDHYLDQSPEEVEEMYFLRYESPNHFSPLPSDEKHYEAGDQALTEHRLALDECQNYAVSEGVTSTYVLFNVARYTQWLEDNHLEDSILNRAAWGAEQIEVPVDTFVSDYAVWYMVTANPHGVTDMPKIMKDMFTEQKHAVIH